MDASKLVVARKQAEMSQEDLAVLAGVAQSTVSSWECGIRVPRPKHAVKIIKAFANEGIEFKAEDFFPQE